MSVRGRYSPGKADYNNSGRRNCRAEFTWGWDGRCFSMQAAIWNPRETDIYCGGQCVDYVASFFPCDAKVKRMVAIWRRWHLNGMRAGSAVQMAWLRANPLDPASYAYPKSYYEAARSALAAAGLNPDADGYHYGSAWKYESLPADIIAEIKSW